MIMSRLELKLPFPPSVNHYWRHVGAKVLISAKGRSYRTLVQLLCLGKSRKCATSLRVAILACPPDHRRRDLDNLSKALLDAMQYSGLYVDDFQIDELEIKRGPVDQNKTGYALVVIEELTR